MQPGRELDALVAEKVMSLYGQEKTVWPNYSTDISSAWAVVEEVRKKSRFDVLSLYSPCDESDKWWAGFERKWPGRNINHMYDLESGITAPHAICLAALKSVSMT